MKKNSDESILMDVFNVYILSLSKYADWSTTINSLNMYIIILSFSMHAHVYINNFYLSNQNNRHYFKLHHIITPERTNTK